MKILAIVKGNSGCDYHRVSLPFSYMEFKQGDSFDYFSDGSTKEESQFADYDIVYFNRSPNFDLSKLLDLRAKYGFKIVCDVDDYWNLNSNHYFYKDWLEHNMKKDIISALGAADLCIATNEQLKEQVKNLNRNCIVIPNALPFGYGQFNDNKTEHESINIVYAGGSSHLPDLRSVQNLFLKLGSDGDFKKRAKITLAGFTDDSERNQANWIRMEGVIKRCGSYERRYSLPLINYMSHYNTADISISPLENNTFNSYKSNLKIIEAGCKGIPCVVSNTKTYWQDLNMKDKGAFFCDTVGDWYSKLKKLINNKDFLEQCGGQLKEYVKDNYNLITWNHQRYYQLQKLL